MDTSWEDAEDTAERQVGDRPANCFGLITALVSHSRNRSFHAAMSSPWPNGSLKMQYLVEFQRTFAQRPLHRLVPCMSPTKPQHEAHLLPAAGHLPLQSPCDSGMPELRHPLHDWQLALRRLAKEVAS